MAYGGQWHGKGRFFGFHHDLHVEAGDDGIGTRCRPAELAEMLRLTGADFVQTDSKGHPGLTSWFSRTPGASVGAGVTRDALRPWRAATRKLSLPLHAHYSGLWDMAAGAKHPDWCIIAADGKPLRGSWKGVVSPQGDKMCPRSPYLRELLIPQMLELIDRYGIDGFWVDGDLWAMEPCYCGRCRRAFTERTGIASPPADPADPNWRTWWNFTRESFEEYVAQYVEAVHRHKPGVLVCSNWLQTFRNPGEPTVPTDWISGDNTPVWGLDSSRCEARFISTRGKPWDIMLWCFYFSRGWLGDPDWAPAMKPVQMLQQEAAEIVALGGRVQTCENPFGLRTGQLAEWRMKRVGELARFVKRRRTLCQDTETIPQVAVLHSEHHARGSARGGNLMWAVDVSPVQGAVFSLLECHYGVDILDEWALLPRLTDFPIVAAPEQDGLSEAMVLALKRYVEDGGRLAVSGAKAFDRFGPDFLGVEGGTLREKAIYHVPAAGGSVPIFSEPWRLVGLQGAEALGQLGLSPLLNEQILPHPAATLNRVGRGAVAYFPFNVFRDFERNRYPMVRAFVGRVFDALAGRLDIHVRAPACIDIVLRRTGGRRIVHLINRTSGTPNLPNNPAVDEIPAVGPVTITMRLPDRPRTVRLAFERERPSWEYARRRSCVETSITVPLVHLHSAVVVE